jgi:hypothetical protein
MMPALIYQLAGCMKTFVCRLVKRSVARRVKFKERRRTLDVRVGARREATKYMRPFQQSGKEEISQLIWISLAGIVDQ